jgi:hypothetical protein
MRGVQARSKPVVWAGSSWGGQQEYQRTILETVDVEKRPVPQDEDARN